MPRIEQLSIYLLKPSILEWDQAIRDTAPYEQVDLPADAPQRAALITRATPPHGPNWTRFFPDQIRQGLQDLLSASSGAVYLVPVNGRWFALCFGTGWHMLRKDAFVRSFGMRVALSVVIRDTLKSVDVSTYDNFAKHRRVSTSRGTTIDSFDIEGQLDLLRGVIGECGFPQIGQQIGGKDACVIWTRVTFDQLPKLCRILLKLYDSPRVSQRYPIVDNVAEVRDPAETLRLDGLLDTQLAADPNHDVSVAPPEVVDWQNVHSFIMDHHNHPAPSISMAFNDIRTMFNPDPLTCDAMRDVEVRTQTPTGADGPQQWTLYDCLVTEIDDPLDLNVKCILVAGEWYVVAASFVKQIDQDLKSVQKHAHKLPDAKPGEKEGEYNERFAKSDPKKYTLLDKKNIMYGGGYSRIEVCDVLSSKSCLYHIKDYTGSATLSHLFSQGTVSARLLLEPDFRRELLAKVSNVPGNVVQACVTNPGSVEVTYAIICDPNRNLPSGLPFFSKVRLVEASRVLRRMGYTNVSVARIVRR